jgi:D-alanyl-D-alanine carboxypeptidase
MVGDIKQMKTALEQRLNKILQLAIERTPIPGISAAVLINGDPVFVSAVGVRELDKAVPLTPQDRFYIYSVTKILIAALILRLVEDGGVDLDAPVQETLPRLDLATPVTIRQLMNHTGGIPDYGGLPAYFEALKADPGHAWSPEVFLENTLAKGLVFAPGQGWAYSNIGYMLLRQVIETVLNTSFRSALQENFFDVLGLKDAFVVQTLADAQPLTPGFSSFFSGGELEDVRLKYHPGWVSHGVAAATASDLAHCIQSIFEGRLFSEQSRKAMLSAIDVKVQHTFFKQPGYGLGVMIDSDSKWGLMVGHGGGGQGYSAGVLHIPDMNGNSVTSAVLVNCDLGDGLHTAFQLAAAVGEMSGQAGVIDGS